jgi:hypothetical protein
MKVKVYILTLLLLLLAFSCQLADSPRMSYQQLNLNLPDGES